MDRETDLEDQVELYLIRAYGGVMQRDAEVQRDEPVERDDGGQVLGFGYQSDRDSGYYSASRSGSESGDEYDSGFEG